MHHIKKKKDGECEDGVTRAYFDSVEQESVDVSVSRNKSMIKVKIK